MAVNFTEILVTHAEEIEKPKPLPIGSYLAINPKLPEFKGLGKNETPAAVFTVTINQPLDDVSPDDLKAYGDVKGKTQRFNRFLSDTAQFRTKEELCETFGIDETGKTLGQIFAETVNKPLIIVIAHRPSDDGTEIYAEVEKTAAA